MNIFDLISAFIAGFGFGILIWEIFTKKSYNDVVDIANQAINIANQAITELEKRKEK